MTTQPARNGVRVSPAVIGLAVLLALVAALALVPVFGVAAWLELLLGWVLAVLNGLAHAWIARRSVGSRAPSFLRWGIVTNALRMAAVLATLLAVCFLTRLNAAAFALSLVAGSVAFLACNATALATAGRDGKNS